MARSNPVACRSSSSRQHTGRRVGVLALLMLSVVWSTAAASEQVQPALRVCADPDNMPLSNRQGEGYENRIAEQLASDLGRRIEYFYFPQRMGFVRNTLRQKDEATQQFKCDVIIGVPKGYELTATTRPYMHSTYALVFSWREELGALKNAEDLLKLEPATLRSLRIGVFGRSPGVDWLLRNDLIERAVMYAPQSGDPAENPAHTIEQDLAAGKIDLAIVWGPIAGFLVRRHAAFPSWRAVPFTPDRAPDRPPDRKIRFDYEISMGVRFGDKEWQQTLDAWIGSHQAKVDAILSSFRIPLLDASGKVVSDLQEGEQARAGGVPKRIPLDATPLQ